MNLPGGEPDKEPATFAEGLGQAVTKGFSFVANSIIKEAKDRQGGTTPVPNDPFRDAAQKEPKKK